MYNVIARQTFKMVSIKYTNCIIQYCPQSICNISPITNKDEHSNNNKKQQDGG